MNISGGAGAGVGVKLCQICLKNDVGKYVCPRCNVLYCSVSCYQSEEHAGCSEEFYKESFLNELESLEPPNVDSRNKMVETLKRLNECDAEDDDSCDHRLDSDDDNDCDGDDLSDRLKGIDLDDADQVWSKLNDKEKLQFENLLESGDVASIVPKFEPWWNYRDDRKVIDLDENDESYFCRVHKSNCPKITVTLIPLSSISKSSPSPVVYYNLINILSAYAFTARFYNGNQQDVFNEATALLINISKNLDCNQNFMDYDTPMKSVCEIVNPHNISEDNFSIVKSDVFNIMRGPHINNFTFYILAALSDIHCLFLKSLKKSLSFATNNKEFSQLSRTISFPCSSGSDLSCEIPKLKIKRCVKKIEYFQSWVVDCYKSPPVSL